MILKQVILAGACVAGLGMPAAKAADVQPQNQSAPSPPVPEKCERSLPPLALYGAANDLLEAAHYAQWVLEDIACKYPENEEAKKALIKLNLAIGKAEGR